MLIYTTATGSIHRGLARRQRESLRIHGYQGDWRCFSDLPEQFEADGLPVPPGAEARTMNRRQKTCLLERCRVAEGAPIVFLEADVLAEAPLAPLLEKIARSDRVLVQRGRPVFAEMMWRERGVEWTGSPDAPWCGLVAVPAGCRETFFQAWREAHAQPTLGYDEVALFSALARVPWEFSGDIVFAPKRAALVHYQGVCKEDWSPEFAREVEQTKAQLLALAETQVLVQVGRAPVRSVAGRPWEADSLPGLRLGVPATS